MRSIILTFLILFSTSVYAQDEMQDDVIHPQLPAMETVQSPPHAAQDVITDVINDVTKDDTHPGDAKASEVVKAPNAASDAAVVPAPTTEPPPTYESKKFAVLQTLDKLTARTATMTVPVGQATAVGPLFVDIKICQKTPIDQLPESVAFLQIWEAKPKPKLKKKIAEDTNEPPSQWVFSGWMFASSPALSAMDHPVYDVWLKDCVNETAVSKEK